MASDQAPGAKIRIYAESPGKDKEMLFQGVNEQTGPGGSPDGAQATVKANELPVMPVSPFVLKGGDKLKIFVELTAADGLDASDAVINVPILRNGQLEYLSRTDFGYTTDYPAASLANVELQLGSGYEIPQGDLVQLGGSTYFISVEDDA